MDLFQEGKQTKSCALELQGPGEAAFVIKFLTVHTKLTQVFFSNIYFCASEASHVSHTAFFSEELCQRGKASIDISPNTRASTWKLQAICLSGSSHVTSILISWTAYARPERAEPVTCALKPVLPKVWSGTHLNPDLAYTLTSLPLHLRQGSQGLVRPQKIKRSNLPTQHAPVPAEVENQS